MKVAIDSDIESDRYQVAAYLALCKHCKSVTQ